MKDKSSANAAWRGSSLQSQLVIGSIEKQAGIFLMEWRGGGGCSYSMYKLLK